MSTHFRPRPQPPPTPSSPARPSTAHSTIRAVTPSPTGSADATAFALPRPKSAHVLGSPEMGTYARYVLQADAGGCEGGGLKRGGGRASPVKRPFSTPGAISAGKGEEQEEGGGEEDEAEENAPDTPTPMTRAQKRQAYKPLRVAPNPAPTSNPTSTSTAPADLPGPPALSPLPRKTLQAQNRISVSGASHITALSTASKNSIFSTPGRDEMERKKALVETDEGPFARVQSMGDLDVERRKVVEEDGEGKKKKKEGRFAGCFVCGVM